MDDKTEKIVAFVRSKEGWVTFNVYFYTNPQSLEVDGHAQSVTEYWSCEIGGGPFYLYKTAASWPALVEKVELLLVGDYGYIA